MADQSRPPFGEMTDRPSAATDFSNKICHKQTCAAGPLPAEFMPQPVHAGPMPVVVLG
jgi:hypothetical protein